jgi:hypothetical protein
MKHLFGIVLLLFTGFVNAATFNSLDALEQNQFRAMSKNLTAASHYKGITPTEPLGILGFDVGLSLSSTQIDKELFRLASSGTYEPRAILLPRLSVHKGLPLGFDIGAFISGAPSTDIKLVGAELRYAIVKGNIALPAIGIRASYSAIEGVSELNVNSTGLDISISKGIANATLYAGAGSIRSNSRPVSAPNLDDESYSQSKTFVGINLFLGINVTLEADRTGGYSSYSAKVGFRF